MAGTRRKAQSISSMEGEYKFYLKADLSPYLGQWVAICDKQIVAHGKSLRSVYDEAVARFPSKRPLVTRVAEKGAMIF